MCEFSDCNMSLSLFPQWPKQRSLHHHSEESRLLAAVWWWHCGGASLTLFSVTVCLMFLDSPVCPFTIVCVISKPCLTCVMQKIDAQAIEEFYGLTSDISKNSESGYILFYQSREWLELDQWHRKRLSRTRPVCLFAFLPYRPRLLPPPPHPPPCQTSLTYVPILYPSVCPSVYLFLTTLCIKFASHVLVTCIWTAL